MKEYLYSTLSGSWGRKMHDSSLHLISQVPKSWEVLEYYDCFFTFFLVLFLNFPPHRPPPNFILILVYSELDTPDSYSDSQRKPHCILLKIDEQNIHFKHVQNVQPDRKNNRFWLVFLHSICSQSKIGKMNIEMS